MSALEPRGLADCRRVFLRGLSVDANIGIHDAEKYGPQRVIVDVDLYVDLARTTPIADRIAEVFDYDRIRQVVTERVGRGHINLQETLCDDVARALLAFPEVRAVRVSTEKPDIYADCDAVGVEVFHLREVAP